MNYKKAQLSSLDLIFALTLFLAILIIFSLLWDLVHYNIKSITAESDIIAIQVTNNLLNNPGYPYDWNATNVEMIGLSSERGVIDQIKFENLLDLLSTDYEKARELLGLAPYNFYINMTDLNGNSILIDGQPAAGGMPPTNATDISSVSRTAIYGEIVVHNNSVTFIYDSSGSMFWFSTSLGYNNGNLTGGWINIYNVTFPDQPASDFDFVLEYNNSGGSYARINVTSPSGKKYNCSSGSSPCNCGTGCVGYHYAGADYLNFTSSRWEAGEWKVYARNTTPRLSYDLMVQTPARRIEAANTSTRNFIDVIANESNGNDNMALFRFKSNACSCGGPCWQMLQNFTIDYPAIKLSVAGITAGGGTPIAESIRAAANSINASYYNSTTNRTHAMMIVVSDGSETCNSTPAQAINDSANYAMDKVRIENFRICTVGFAQGYTGETQLRAIAEIGKCKYYSARNQAELELALRQIYFGNLEKQKVIINIMVWK